VYSTLTSILIYVLYQNDLTMKTIITDAIRYLLSTSCEFCRDYIYTAIIYFMLTDEK